MWGVIGNEDPGKLPAVAIWLGALLAMTCTPRVLAAPGNQPAGVLFNQFLLAPYFGPGLPPHEQTLWIDALTVGRNRLGPVAKAATSEARKKRAGAEDRRGRIRLAAAQPRNRTIDFRLKSAQVLERLDQSLKDLERLVRKAGEASCGLFRERVPAAYGILTEPNPPVLAKVRSNVTRDEAIRIMATALTTGEQRFNRAAALARSGKTEEAIRLFEQLCIECRTSWIKRTGREQIEQLRSPTPTNQKPSR